MEPDLGEQKRPMPPPYVPPANRPMPPPYVPPPAAAQRSTHRTLWLVLAAAALVLIVGLVVAVVLLATRKGNDDVDASSSSGPSIQTAANACGPMLPRTKGYDFHSDDQSITINATGTSVESDLYALTAAACVVDKLDGPGSVGDRIEHSMGTTDPDSAAWGDFQANWALDADTGFQFTVATK